MSKYITLRKSEGGKRGKRGGGGGEGRYFDYSRLLNIREMLVTF